MKTSTATWHVNGTERSIIMAWLTRALLTLVVVGALAANADEPKKAKGTLPDLTWMAGSFAGHVRGVDMEETWLGPKGGLMLGAHRDVVEGKAVNYELLRIEEDAAGIVYTSTPNGKVSTAFRLTQLADRRVTFENPQHDFPKKIIYWESANKELCARIEGPQGGKTVSDEWCWPRSNAR
jgi:hypothetical protein